MRGMPISFELPGCQTNACSLNDPAEMVTAIEQ